MFDLDNIHRLYLLQCSNNNDVVAFPPKIYLFDGSGMLLSFILMTNSCSNTKQLKIDRT